MTNKKTIWIGVVVILIAAIGIYFFQFKKDKTETRYKPIKVTRGDIGLSISSAGTIVPETSIEIKSKASGKILNILVRDGDFVKKGQLLLVLDKTDEETRVKQAQSDVLSAEAKLIQAKEKLAEAMRNTVQTKSLLDDKLASKEDYLKALSQQNINIGDVKMASANLINVQEKLKSEQLNYADTEIVAPISGLILTRLVQEGQIISSGISASSGGTSLFTIGNMSKIISKSEVDEVDIGKLELGMPVELEVDAYPGKIFKGKLSHISPQGRVNSNVTVFDVEVDIQDRNKSLLKAGMTNTAKIIVQSKKNVLTIPSYVISGRGRHQTVWIKKGKTYIQTSIRTGLNNYEQVEILNGLSEGDTVYMEIPDAPKTKKPQFGQSNNRDQSRATMRAMRGR